MELRLKPRLWHYARGFEHLLALGEVGVREEPAGNREEIERAVTLVML
jgi:hypothetical protein